MSWYVRELLLNSDQIRSAVYKMAEHQDALDYDESVPSYHYYDYDEDTYLNLISVEQKYVELLENGFITTEEDRIFNAVITKKTISQIEQDECVSRPTILKRFHDICERIAFHLGGYFTDDGFIFYMINKYNLNDEEVEKLRKYISEEK